MVRTIQNAVPRNVGKLIYVMEENEGLNYWADTVLYYFTTLVLIMQTDKNAYTCVFKFYTFFLPRQIESKPYILIYKNIKVYFFRSQLQQKKIRLRTCIYHSLQFRGAGRDVNSNE